MTIDLPFSHWIDGKPGAGDASGTIQVVDPSQNREIWSFAEDSPAVVASAVESAQGAFQDWSRATPGERSTTLLALASELGEQSEELARVESAQCGKPIRLAREFDVPGSIDNVAFFAGAARHLEGKSAGEYSPTHTSMIRREALGVVGSIAPWNYPLQMAVWKIMPALAAGNTVVIKPAQLTPLTTLMLAEATERAGLPAGVLNVVNGSGRSTGEALASHPGLAMTSFTGSTDVGRHIARLAGAHGTRVHLELGGKAPFVVFDDCDISAAARGAVAASLINAGQDCTAATRAYVQRPLFEAFVAAVAELMMAVRIGAPADPDTDMGPLSSLRQRDQVAAMVERALADGARAVVGGRAPGGDLATGAYYEPTLLVDVDQRSEIVQDEVFGPVLVVLPFDSDDEGLQLANDCAFGLAASAWTSNVFRAQRAARELVAGTVWINDHIPIVSEMPHGGTKASGFGKDMSAYSFEEYTQIKHVMTELTGEADKPWHATVFRDRSGGSR